MYFVYVLKSINYKKSYVGHTDNLERRLTEHNNGKSEYTRRYKPWKIIYKEVFDNIGDAIKREKYFKSHAGRNKLKEIFNDFEMACLDRFDTRRAGKASVNPINK